MVTRSDFSSYTTRNATSNGASDEMNDGPSDAMNDAKIDVGKRCNELCKSDAGKRCGKQQAAHLAMQ
jgi:hypothetical protein